VEGIYWIGRVRCEAVVKTVMNPWLAVQLQLAKRVFASCSRLVVFVSRQLTVCFCHPFCSNSTSLKTELEKVSGGTKDDVSEQVTLFGARNAGVCVICTADDVGCTAHTVGSDTAVRRFVYFTCA
jgi:hypothetical protein